MKIGDYVIIPTRTISIPLTADPEFEVEEVHPDARFPVVLGHMFTTVKVHYWSWQLERAGVTV